MVTLFWICVLLIVWAYAGYPLSMYLLAKYRPTAHFTREGFEPSISVIIAAANEEENIFRKLLNVFDTKYPHDKIQVIITLDGCTDGTLWEISQFLKWNPEYKDTVHVLDNDKGGKEAAQLKAVEIATGTISIFTDVATTLKPDAFHKLVRHFDDMNIGAVDGMSRVRSNGHSSEGLYLKYENKIREWMSATCGITACGGCLFAARTQMLRDTILLQKREGSRIIPYAGFLPYLQSDFRTALAAKTFGYRSVLDREAVAEFADGKPGREYLRKHRTIVRGIHTFLNNLHLLNPLKHGLFSYALFNHKLLKWLVPFFMIGAWVANANLAFTTDSMFWMTLYIIHCVTYILAFIHFKNKFGKILHFFVITNIAILNAWISYIQGERFTSWEPTKR